VVDSPGGKPFTAVRVVNLAGAVQITPGNDARLEVSVEVRVRESRRDVLDAQPRAVVIGEHLRLAASEGSATLANAHQDAPDADDWQLRVAGSSVWRCACRAISRSRSPRRPAW
jgi:hypothetical protein